MLRKLILTLAVLAGIVTATGCQEYPSGCIRLAHNELPFPISYNHANRAVSWHHGGQVSFVGISAQDPDQYFTDTWHGPSHYTGWNEYLSAMRCFQTGGQSATP